MRTKDTSGPAYPMQDAQAIHAYAAGAVVGITDPAECDRAYMAARAQAVGGLTKREAFAMAAMQGLLANPANQGATADQIAAVAWHQADKMLQWGAN